VAYNFNDFAVKNFTSFIEMTLVSARKTITVVFGTMALQLTNIFQCSVTYSMKQTSSFFSVVMLSLIALCVTAALKKNVV